MPDPFDLQRFVDAQNARGVHDEAIVELRRGRKKNHWMWFVFPQIAGLGNSAMSRRYAISGIVEARAYLQHPLLGPRLLEISTILAQTRDLDAEQIFGAIDARKLCSSMTLFLRADPAEPVFARVLDLFAGGRPDPMTDRLVGLG